MSEKIWFITGASRGFGRIWTEAALKRGDKVVATARNIATLAPLTEAYGPAVLPLTLDVNDRDAALSAVGRAQAHFGRIDVLINNGGFGVAGAIEELSEEDVRAQFETNVFGALWVTQAVLPIMRAQKNGHILSVSSLLGVVAMPNLGIYNASKWALEGMMDTLAQEVGDKGINVTLIEPGAYTTDFSDASSMRLSQPMDAYEGVRQQMMAALTPDMFGDPHATAEAVLGVVDAAAPPLRIFLGAAPASIARQVYQQRLAIWDQWAGVSVKAHGAV
ncbi:MAG TPA: SDR family NAD(P)-dependent oxidoreductase [Duganella sp.]|jgi:NAD(P)-dependent dehydrogenase (short-subunit alcohol dehydrogenase family)